MQSNITGEIAVYTGNTKTQHQDFKAVYQKGQAEGQEDRQGILCDTA